MTKHEVSATLPKGITVGNVDVEIAVRADKKPMGRLKASKGGLEWVPVKHSVNTYKMSWEKFERLMTGD